MTRTSGTVTRLWWLVHKDLVSEFRARQAWPAMLLLAMAVTFLFSIQINLPAAEMEQLIGCLFWLAVYFAGTLVFGQSLAAEREAGCWEGLLLYPVASETIYLAKLIVNVLALTSVECVLIPLFSLFAGVPLLDHPWHICLVAFLGNVGIASIGTLVSALSSGVRRSGSLLTILTLPLLVPILLAASEATRLTVAGDLGAEWWQWVQLMGGFAIVFVTAGTVLFEFTTEE